MNNVRCPVCLKEFNLDQIRSAGNTACPSCGTQLAPILISHDGYIKTNWQDIRMLAIFAKRWAAHFDPIRRGNRDTIVALDNIIKSLERFQPRGGAPLLIPNDDLIKPVKQGQPILLYEEKEKLERMPDGSVVSPWQIKQ